MTVRNVTETAAWLHQQVKAPFGYPAGRQGWKDYCLGLQTAARNIPPHYETAWEAWLGAKQRHSLPDAHTVFHLLPRGVCLFYRSLIPGHEDGHVVFYDGMGRYGPLCATNDVPDEQGNVSFINPLWFLVNWDMTLVGFTEDLNGEDLSLGPAAVRVVHLAVATECFSHPGRAPKTWWVGYQMREIQRALGSKDVTGTITRDDVRRYASFQQSLGFSGADADGIPGLVSLTQLGHVHGFEVLP